MGIPPKARIDIDVALQQRFWPVTGRRGHRTAYWIRQLVVEGQKSDTNAPSDV